LTPLMLAQRSTVVGFLLYACSYRLNQAIRDRRKERFAQHCSRHAENTNATAERKFHFFLSGDSMLRYALNSSAVLRRFLKTKFQILMWKFLPCQNSPSFPSARPPRVLFKTLCRFSLLRFTTWHSLAICLIEVALMCPHIAN
jgi:hypothetical protein